MRRIRNVALALAVLFGSACTGTSTEPTPAGPHFDGGGMVGSGNGVGDPGAGTQSMPTDTTGRSGGGMVGSGN